MRNVLGVATSLLLVLSACDRGSPDPVGPLIPQVVPSFDTSADEWIVDTGPAFIQDPISLGLFNRGNHVPWCNPQPRCSDDFGFDAGQFTLENATVVSS